MLSTVNGVGKPVAVFIVPPFAAQVTVLSPPALTTWITTLSKAFVWVTQSANVNVTFAPTTIVWEITI